MTSNVHPQVVLATFGTHGDIHPFIAIALALQMRGIHPIVAAAEMYRAKIEAEGIQFHHMRPDLDAVATRLGMQEQAMMRAAAERPEFIVRDIILPHLRETYDDVIDVIRDADAVVLHSAAYGAKLAAEKVGTTRINIVLQPLMLLSSHDPPVIATSPRLSRFIYAMGPAWTRRAFAVSKFFARPWARAITQLRKELGLPDTHDHPLFEGQLHGATTIALFSPLFGAPQPDHPPGLSIAGFAFYDSDQAGKPALSHDVERFLGASSAPIVFTQGTSAVHDADDFIRESLDAVRMLGYRALFVLDAERTRSWAGQNSASVLITGYAPYSLLFPRSCANVHHGGVGTTAQALRAGRPQLIAPYLVDQPDNAARVAKLGAGRTIALEHYRATRVARELRTLIEDPTYAARAADVGREIAKEDGASAAADLIANIVRDGAKR